MSKVITNLCWDVQSFFDRAVWMAFPMSRSAALGLAVSAAVAYGYSNIFVTASWPRYGRGCIQPCPKSSWQYGENLNPVLQGGNQRSVTIQDIIMLLSRYTLLVLLCALSRVFSWLWDVLAFPAIIVVSAQKPLFTGPDEDTACCPTRTWKLKSWVGNWAQQLVWRFVWIFRCTDSIPHNFSGLGMVGTCAFACLRLCYSVWGAISWEFEHGLRVHSQRFWCLRDEGHMDQMVRRWWA